ncbi:hypothetical protein GN956_G26358 [Arapaima gigas]
MGTFAVVRLPAVPMVPHPAGGGTGPPAPGSVTHRRQGDVMKKTEDGCFQSPIQQFSVMRGQKQRSHVTVGVPST